MKSGFNVLFSMAPAQRIQPNLLGLASKDCVIWIVPHEL